MLAADHWTESSVLIGVVRERIEGAWRGLQPLKNNNTNQELSGTKLPPIVHLDRPMAPAAYVGKDSLVGHQWEEKPLVLQRLDPPV